MSRRLTSFAIKKRLSHNISTSSRSSSWDDSSDFGSLQDNLPGLIDSSFSGFSNESSGPQASMKDFAFLQENAEERPSFYPNGFSPQAVMISKAVRACSKDFENKAARVLRHFREGLDEHVVADVIRIVKVTHLCVKFFTWAGRQIGFSHTRLTFDALVDVLGFDETSRGLEGFLREIGENDKEVLGKLLNVLVLKCCYRGLWREALEELGKLKDFGYRPTGVTYNALIQVMVSAERLDTALLVLKEMTESGFCINRLTMGVYARALCKAGRWVEALNLIAREDYTLDTVMCTQMIDGLLEASLFEEAMSFLHRLRANSCIPNVVTYRTLLSGFLKKQQLGWCKRIINMMITEGCNPSTALFNSLVHNYCKVGDYEYGYKLLKKMDACGCSPGYVTYNIFIGSICSKEELPSLDLLNFAEKAYSDMLRAGVVLNKNNVANFSRCLCFSGKPDKAFVIIKDMMKKGFHPDTTTYTKVITFLCQVQKVEKALLLFEEMKKTNIVPDVYTYTILIDSFCKVGLIQQARRWFEEMQSSGCTPNVVTYTALLHAYLKAKRLSDANALFNRMISAGFHPNIVTFTALIDGLCKAGEVDKARQIYDRLLGSCEDVSTEWFFQVKHDAALQPNVVTYGALMDGLCKAHRVIESHDILEVMKSACCQPNVVIFDALIDGFCKTGKLDISQELVRRMSTFGLAPDLFTYTSLIDRLFKDKKLDLAMKVLSQMLESSYIPDVVTYTSMIDGLCKVGKVDEALKLSSVMKERGCNPNVVTYTALIDGFGKSHRLEMCLKLFREMSNSRCFPNFITYKVLINHCCAANRLDEAHQLLKEMKETCLPPYLTGNDMVIQGLTKNFVSSLGLLEDMVSYDEVSVGPVYGMLINNFYKAGKLDVAFMLCKELIAMPRSSAVNSKHNLIRNMSLSVIQGLCLASKVEKALDLYSDMTRRGIVPELETFVWLMKGLFRVNMCTEALQLCYGMLSEGVVWQNGEEGD